MKYFLLVVWLWPLLLSAQAVTDATGQRLVLAQPAQRIVALSPHLTELVYAIGAEAQLVGVSAYSDYPAAARGLPQLSDHAHVDFERLQSLRPDLVLAWGSGNRAQDIQRLRDLGLPVYVNESRQLEDIAQSMVDLGEFTGHAGQAKALAAEYMRALMQLRARYAGQPSLRVFYQISTRPLMTVNGEHLISQALAVCGAVNVFADLSLLAPTVSQEAVLVIDPDVIVVGDVGEGARAGLDLWRARTQMRAVKTGSLRSVSADLLHRATPRVLSGIEQLCEVLRAGT